MKKKKIITLGLCTLMLCGCGKEIPTLSDGSQAVVSFEDGSLNISANELYENLKKQYALDNILQMLDKKILEKEYSDSLDDAKTYAKETVNSMKATYGEEQIEAYFGSIDSYTDYLYTSNLQQKAILDYAKTLVTEKEIKSYYDKNIYGDVVVDHILIKTNVTDDTSEEDKTKLEDEAKKKINEIIEKLDKADDKLAKFKELAKEYSDDDATKENGGSLGAINTDTLSSSYDEILKSARSLKDGTYSKDLIITELGYHVIFKEKTEEKKSLDEVKDSVIESLANDKLSSDSTLNITAMQKLREKYKMNIEDSDIKDKYSKYITNSIAQAREADAAQTK